MEYIKGTTDFSIEEPSVVTIGKFDGLHVGHQKLLDRVIDKKKDGVKAVVFTFDVPPSVKLTGKGLDTLVTNEERCRMLSEKGIDYLVECPFVPEVLSMEPERFVEDVLVGRLKAKYIVVGTDCGFGHNRRGNYQLLQTLADKYGYQVEVVEKVQYEGRDISSTYVREEIAKGNMELANFLLGYTYAITGQVSHGNHIGAAKLDMPTANILPPKHKLLPPNGVYATKTRIDGKWYPGISNIGTKPTVSDQNRKGIETFIFDFEGDLYGKEVTVELYTYERPEMKFSGLEELKERMHLDMEFGKKYFA
ncbi:MAG: bifunctional riboflavin kinase/FAD synthetase [Oscillospiraceae bacterium]|nr:bifunctional riboflavin kinase/FAD synthetase [Oscillospiraceae bacterium]